MIITILFFTEMKGHTPKQVWWCILIISSLRRLRQEHPEFEPVGIDSKTLSQQKEKKRRKEERKKKKEGTPKICMEIQKSLNSQSNDEGKKNKARSNTILEFKANSNQSYSNQNSKVLTKKKKKTKLID
jgi:hypothetical protein